MPAETHVEQGPLDRNSVFELIRGYGQVCKTPFGGGTAVNQVTCEHELFRPRGPELERPHRRRRTAPYPGRHVPDAPIVGDDIQIQIDVEATKRG